MNDLKLLKKLVETPGPSGNEAAIAAQIADVWRPLVDELRTDRVGSLVGIKRGRGPTDDASSRRRILLAAHMDELGLMVKQIVAHPDESGSGFLRVTSLGGVDRRQLFAQQVVVHGQRELPGVIGGLPGSMVSAARAKKPYNFEELVVDVGLPADQVRELVSVGDFISFRQPLHKLLNGRVAGKALDNRASVAAVTRCLHALQTRDHSWDVYAVATVQEETRLLGAYISGYVEEPDAAIAIDVTHGKGPGTRDVSVEMDGGPVLDIGPNVHPGMRSGLREAADRLEMKTQVDIHTRGSGTDAYGLQVARAGVPTAVVSIPLRYMHTMVESIAVKDVKRTGRLLAEFITGLDDDFLPSLARQMLGDD